jgi:hypothetical protein
MSHVCIPKVIVLSGWYTTATSLEYLDSHMMLGSLMVFMCGGLPVGHEITSRSLNYVNGFCH